MPRPASPTTRPRRSRAKPRPAVAQKAAVAFATAPAAQRTLPTPTPPAGSLTRSSFRALCAWPAVLDRARFTLIDLLPIGFGEQTRLVRELLAPLQEWEAAHPDAETVPIPQELIEAIRDWPLYLDRARYSGRVPLSMNELMALAQAAPEVRALHAAHAKPEAA